MNKFNVGDKVLYYGKKYKIDHIRDDGTAKIHSISGKTNEICYRADISKFKLENIKIRFKNGSSIETIDMIEEPKRGQRAKIYPVDDYREPSVCDDCEIGDGWEC